MFYFLCQFRAASVEGMTHWQEAITKGIQMVADEEDGGDMWGLLFWSFLSLESLGWESLFQQGLGGISSLPLARAHACTHTYMCIHSLSVFYFIFDVYLLGGGGGGDVFHHSYMSTHFFFLFLTIIF